MDEQRGKGVREQLFSRKQSKEQGDGMEKDSGDTRWKNEERKRVSKQQIEVVGGWQWI